MGVCVCDTESSIAIAGLGLYEDQKTLTVKSSCDKPISAKRVTTVRPRTFRVVIDIVTSVTDCRG